MQPSVLGSCHIFETPSVIFADTTRPSLSPLCHSFFIDICTCLLMSHSRVLYVHVPSCHFSLIQAVFGSFCHVTMVLCVYWCHCRSLLICERQRALYGIKCDGKKNLTLCKHVPCNTLTHSTNEDLLNIKRKGDPEVSYPLSYVRYHWNPEPVCNKSHFVSLFYLYWYFLIY